MPTPTQLPTTGQWWSNSATHLQAGRQAGGRAGRQAGGRAGRQGRSGTGEPGRQAAPGCSQAALVTYWPLVQPKLRAAGAGHSRQLAGAAGSWQLVQRACRRCCSALCGWACRCCRCSTRRGSAWEGQAREEQQAQGSGFGEAAGIGGRSSRRWGQHILTVRKAALHSLPCSAGSQARAAHHTTPCTCNSPAGGHAPGRTASCAELAPAGWAGPLP